MSIARVTEIISGSDKSFDDAIKKGIKRASIMDQDMSIGEDGKITEYRVKMRVTFVLKD